MPIVSISQGNDVLTPQKLLSVFKQGDRPEYKHEKDNDPLLKNLDMLAKNYRQTMTMSSKKDLINQEKQILLDGLKNPEMTLARNYENITNLVCSKKPNIRIEDVLRLFDATALNRLLGLPDDFKTFCSIGDVEIVKNAYLSIDENSNIGCRAKTLLVSILNKFGMTDSTFRDVVDLALQELLTKTTNLDLIRYINQGLGISEVDVKQTLNKVLLVPNSINNLRLLLTECAANSNDEISKLVGEFLVNKNVNQDVYEVAILGAGKFRSDENFEKLKSIALNVSAKNVRYREFALHSISLYVREKPKEVKEVLNLVSKEKSIYSPLATILNDKINGNYHCQENRELKYLEMS